MRVSRALTSLAAAALIAGCESEPTTPTVNVDAVLAQMSSSSVSGYAAAAASASGAVIPSIPTGGSTSSCAYNADTKFFVCPTTNTNGVTMSRSFQLLDVTGAPLSSPNPLALAAVRSVVDINGTITSTTSGGSTTEITRHEDATLSGLLGANRLLNASSTQRLALTGTGFSFVSNDTSKTTDLKLPASAEQKYPLGGTIVTDRTVNLSSVAGASHHQHEEISFDGTSIITIKITSGTTTTTSMTCKIDLAKPGVASACS